MHYFPSMSWDEIMYQRSYANIMMLMATIPNYDDKKDNDIEEEIETEEDMANFFKK